MAVQRMYSLVSLDLMKPKQRIGVPYEKSRAWRK